MDSLQVPTLWTKDKTNRPPEGSKRPEGKILEMAGTWRRKDTLLYYALEPVVAKARPRGAAKPQEQMAQFGSTQAAGTLGGKSRDYAPEFCTNLCKLSEYS